jgi:hypothetical protein
MTAALGLLAAFFNGRVAAAVSYRFGWTFFLSLIFTPLPVLIAIVFHLPRKFNIQFIQGIKCSNCNEYVKPGAKLCPFCKSEI